MRIPQALSLDQAKMSHFVYQGYEPKIAEWVMSDIADINSAALRVGIS